jgi:RNA polymerase sigma factor (sigma-70 family)
MDTAADKKEFLQLIQDNQRIIFKICNSYCSNANDREDLGQEIVYQLWKSGKSFDADHKFSTWMYRVALNVAISFYRKKITSPVISFTENDIDLPDKTSGADELEENIDHLQKFIAAMKELDRALMLLYLEAKPYQEIAEILGISETNVATKISRIKEGLKQKFSNLKK